MKVKDIPVNSVYKPCDHQNEIWSDIEEVRWYFDQAPTKVSITPERKGYSEEELGIIRKIRKEHIDAVRHCDH